ncbi:MULTISPECIES: DinB/UmuC family translesion DNA polymerase [Pacificimonas]|nr:MULTISPECIES: DNA polymerase Y family protein [Pacificimonas]
MNGAARAMGLERGARVTDLRALVPDLLVEDAMPADDAADLERLAIWSRRWCPWTQVDGTDGLLLDISGCAHLFGGETALLNDMARAFAAAGLTIYAAAAATAGAAWALCRHGPSRRLSCKAENLEAMLAPLPAASLRLEGDTLLLLNRLGLKRVGDLMAVPREALMRRFRKAGMDANPVLRLDQALGRLAEPLVPGREAPPPSAIRRFAEPVGDPDDLSRILGDLVADLVRRLAEEELGARHLRLLGYRVDGTLQAIEARTSTPSRDAGHLARLFAEELPRLDPGFGFDAVGLEAVRHDPLSARQDELAGEAEAGVPLAALVDRLVARLGPRNVTRLHPAGSHLPERAQVHVSALAAGDAPPSPSSAKGWDAVPRGHGRPARLLTRPEAAQVLYAVPEGPPARMTWRRRTYRIVRSEGPERIAPEWWREKSTTRLRDYYRVEDDEGRRYWLYREGVPGDGRGGAPQWFVQGLFG